MIAAQLFDWDAMAFKTAENKMPKWLEDAKKSKTDVIEGGRGCNGKPSAKGRP